MVTKGQLLDLETRFNAIKIRIEKLSKAIDEVKIELEKTSIGAVK